MTAPATAQATGPAPQRSNWHPGLLASLLRSNRLTLLGGEPGPSRDALLRRGLIPTLHPLHRQGSAGERALRFDSWGTLPVQALREQIDKVLPGDTPLPAQATLAEQLGRAWRRHGVQLLLVLDAFERHLDEPADRPDIARFDRELAACIADEQLPLHVLLVVDPARDARLQRYATSIPELGLNRLRLPPPTPEIENQWRDTDIHAPPPWPDEMEDEQRDELDAPLDLSLDEPADAAQVPPTHGEAAGPTPLTPRDAAAPTPSAERDATAAPLMAAAKPPAPTQPFGLAARSAADAPWARPDAPARRAPQAQPSAWSAPAQVPPWARPDLPPGRTEADRDTLARTQGAPRWWQREYVRIAADLVALLAGAWLVASWIIGNDRPALRHAQPTASTQGAVRSEPQTPAPVNADGATAQPSPAPAPPGVAQSPQPLPQAVPPTAPSPPQSLPQAPPQAPPTAVAPPAAMPPVATAPTPQPAPTLPARRPLAVALSPEAGSAGPMLDELARTVAAPAGIAFTAAGPSEPAALTVLRTDALQAMRGSGAPPLRVIGPLFSEQIQVIVRTDAPWDYVHQIKSLRLNVGRADGSRGRTARTLYRELFGFPLPAWATNELDEAAALQKLMQRNGPVDAVIVVSESPLLPQLPAEMRKQLRELSFNPGRSSPLRTYWTRRSAGDKPRPAVTDFLVALGPTAQANEPTLRALAAALCRAQPQLQARGSALMRGFTQGEQPQVGWAYVLPRGAGGGCPADPLLDARAARPERKTP